MKKIIKKLYKIIKTVICDFVNSFKIYKIARGQTYYPELKRKRFLRRVLDNLYWNYRYHEINQFYNLYGLDIKGSVQKVFLDYRKFMNTRNKYQNQRSINTLRDKFQFYCYCKSIGVNTPEVLAIVDIKNKNCNWMWGGSTVNKNVTLFAKTIAGECAEGVYRLRSIDEVGNLPDGKYIIEECLIQSKELNSIYSGSINTLRLITYVVNDEIKVLNAVLRVGTSKTNGVDNWAKGGIAIPVDSNGVLMKYGCIKPLFNEERLRLNEHPDSNVKFEGFILSKYNDAIKVAINAHQVLKDDIKFIGWDIAFTENGPSIIEGNDNFEISLMQFEKPLRAVWDNILKELR